MDDVRVGRALRSIRVRRGLTQSEVGIASGTSRHLVGRIERGDFRRVRLADMRAVAAALDADVDLVIRWRGGDLGRLISARHSALHELAAARFVALTEWQFEPEVSFSIFGERGVIDALGWHPDSGSLLVVELKTEFVDVNELMASMDRRMRLAASIALSRGWRGQTVSCWVAVADGRTNRRALARHAAVLRAKFPDDGRRLAAWLRTPHGTVRALGFLPIADTMSSSGGIAGARRVHHAADRPRV